MAEESIAKTHKVVAKRGNPQTLLLANKKQKDQGRIFDARNKLVYPEQHIQSLIKWGYWSEHEMTEEDLAALLEGAAILEKQD